MARIDFAEMAKRSLGAEWKRRTGAKQKAFVNAFTGLLFTTYVESIEFYRGDEIRYLNERLEDSFGEVGTSLIGAKGQKYSVVYRLHQERGEWRIYDAVLEYISLVNNYRAQFQRLIAKSGYDELVRRIDKRASEVRKKHPIGFCIAHNRSR